MNTPLKVAGLISLLSFTACSKPAPIETVESLSANPKRLRELQQQCREHHAQIGDPLCRTVSAAWRQRFMGDGSSHYTPPSSPD